MTPPVGFASADFIPERGGVAMPAAGLARGRLAAVVADVAQLVRPKISLMVLATVVAAYWLTAGRPAAVAPFLALLAGTALVAASSSIANQILERHSDRRMPRTARRPVATGRLGIGAAGALAAVTLGVGTAAIVTASGWQPAAAALATWLVYVGIYTPLKRITPLNTAVGAVAGALPVAIGWLAADGPARLASGDGSGALAAAALGTVLYLWQFPHFMAIAWLYRDQYAAADLRMLTVLDPTGLRAAGQSLAAALAMVPVSLVLAVPSGSPRLFFVASVCSAVYVAAAIRFAVRRDRPGARLLLFTSLGSLLGLLVAAVTLGAAS